MFGRVVLSGLLAAAIAIPVLARTSIRRDRWVDLVRVRASIRAGGA